MARISSVHDLLAADALYLQICSSNFQTGKSIPLVFMSYADLVTMADLKIHFKKTSYDRTTAT